MLQWVGTAAPRKTTIADGPRDNTRFILHELKEWLGSRVVSMLDAGAEGPGFKSQPRRCRVTVFGKLFTPIMPHRSPSSETGSSPFKGCEGNCGPGRK